MVIQNSDIHGFRYVKVANRLKYCPTSVGMGPEEDNVALR